MRTVLVLSEQLEAEEIDLDGETFRHLFRAARHRRGDRVRLVDGAGGARWAEVEEVARRSARLRLGSAAPSGEAPLRVDLWVAAPKAGRATWLVEKATELGVRRIDFVRTSRAPRSLGDATLERLSRVAAAAVEQSHRSVLPRIGRPSPLGELIAGDRPRRILHLDPRGASRLAAAPTDDLVLAVGPEGGWTPSDLELLTGAGSSGLSLGASTLRIETAAVAGLACVLAALSVVPGHSEL
jgi:16S rRNA (uracil1498-N3)-methyltransferase